MPKNNRRARRRRGTRRGKKGGRERGLVSVMNASHVPRSLGKTGPFPQEEMINYRFYERLAVQGSASFVVVDYRVNSVWQPRSATGTSSGYVGSSARYASYRVENFKLTINVAADESTLNVAFGVIFNDTQPSTIITTYQQAETAITSPMSYFRGTVGIVSGMSIYRSPGLSINPGAIVGNPLMYFSDRDFASPFGSNPNQAVWCSFIAISSGSSSNLTAGITLTWDSEMRTRNFGPLILS